MALWTATKVSTLSSEIIKASHPARHVDASACATTYSEFLCSVLCHFTHGMEDSCTGHHGMHQPAGHLEPALSVDMCH